MAAPLAHSGATVNTMSRLTRENRKLTYRLRVIQQPERARACGSGAKSSADRRPVDPPPVVELRIFEGDTNTDITFSHNANFVLFATLEQARPIAHGRVPQSASQAPSPVLTGIPVSSMAYLDRPEPAGYFIFPDLSVRHEGKYKLVFNLYEEVKDPKDEDAEPAANHPNHPDNKQKSRQADAPQEFQHWRLEVQSNPFSVFSAKKFPGLAESTALSRIVAEQGCRVRIRRDVRMRRRDNKSSKDYDDYDDEPSYPPAPESIAGDAYQDRQRAPSDANADYASAHRRQSAHDSAGGYYSQPQQQQQPQPYQQPPYQAAAPTAAPAPPQAPAPTAPTAYATPQPAPQQYGPPRYPQTAASAPPAAQPYAEGQYSYPEHQQQQQPQHYAYPQRPEVEQYPARAESVDSKPAPGTEWRQPAYPAPPQVSTYPEKYAYGHPNYSGYMQPPAAPRAPTPSSTTSALPPLKMPLPVEPKYENAASPSAGQGVSQQQPAVPLPSPAFDSSASSRYSQQYPPTPVTGSSERSGGKRSFGAVFESSHFDQSLTNGSRPSDAYYGADLMQPDYDDDDSSSPYEHAVKMQYKRADGTEISRRLTGHC